MTVETLKVNGLEITVIRKPIKNMYLRVRRNGEIEISANPKMTMEFIQSFVAQKWAWIEKKREATLTAISKTIASDEILYFGKPLKMKVAVSKKFSFNIIDDELKIEAPTSYSDDKLITAVKNEMFKELQRKINTYLHYYWPYFAKQGIEPIEIKYRLMTSTWGVCRPTRGVITFNKQLIHQPDTFIEYVVVHELSHLLQPNHSKHFYEVVEFLLPQWKAYENKKN